MPDTSHYPTDAQMPRLVTAYQKTDKGLVKNAEFAVDVEQGLLRRRRRADVDGRRLFAFCADAGQRRRTVWQASAEPANGEADEFRAHSVNSARARRPAKASA